MHVSIDEDPYVGAGANAHVFKISSAQAHVPAHEHTRTHSGSLALCVKHTHARTHARTQTCIVECADVRTRHMHNTQTHAYTRTDIRTEVCLTVWQSSTLMCTMAMAPRPVSATLCQAHTRYTFASARTHMIVGAVVAMT